MSEDRENLTAIRENEDLAGSRDASKIEYKSRGSPTKKVVQLNGGVWSLLSYDFFTSETFKKIMMYILIALVVFTVVGVGLYNQAPTYIVSIIGNILTTFFLLFKAIIHGIYWVLILNDWTSLPIIFFIVFYFISTKVRSLDFDIWWILYFDGGKNIDIIMYQKYYDMNNRPYVAVPTGFWYKLLFGPAVFPFHESMKNASLDSLNMTVKFAGAGLRPTVEWKGDGLILQTDPNDGIEISEEVAQIFRFIDVPTDDPEIVEIQLMLEETNVMPVDMWRKFYMGVELDYYKDYIKAMQKNVALSRELTIVRFGGALKHHAEYYPTYEGLAAQSRGEDLTGPLIEEFRQFDSIEDQVKRIVIGED